MSSLNSIGQSVFELESRNENVDGQMDIGHINLIGGLVTCNLPKNPWPFHQLVENSLHISDLCDYQCGPMYNPNFHKCPHQSYAITNKLLIFHFVVKFSPLKHNSRCNLIILIFLILAFISHLFRRDLFTSTSLYWQWV